MRGREDPLIHISDEGLGLLLRSATAMGRQDLSIRYIDCGEDRALKSHIFAPVTAIA